MSRPKRILSICPTKLSVLQTETHGLRLVASSTLPLKLVPSCSPRWRRQLRLISARRSRKQWWQFQLTLTISRDKQPRMLARLPTWKLRESSTSPLLQLLLSASTRLMERSLLSTTWVVVLTISLSLRSREEFLKLSPQTETLLLEVKILTSRFKTSWSESSRARVALMSIQTRVPCRDLERLQRKQNASFPPPLKPPSASLTWLSTRLAQSIWTWLWLVQSLNPSLIPWSNEL